MPLRAPTRFSLQISIHSSMTLPITERKKLALSPIARLPINFRPRTP